MKKIAVLLTALALLLVFASAVAEEKVAVKMYENVGAYSKPSPYSEFVGWAKMETQVPVLERVTGNKGRTWIRTRLEDGTEGYIPETMTSEVIENIEEATLSYVLVNHESNIHVHRKPMTYHDCNGYHPQCGSPLMAWAKKGQVYPVIEGPTASGWVRIALENGTTGWVSGDHARPYDPEKDGKAMKIRVTHDNVVMVHEKARQNSPRIAGVRPNEEFKCVYVCDNGWYEIEFPSGAYGYISAKYAELIVEE